MQIFQEIVLYFFFFVGIYFEVFILFTFVLHKPRINADGSRSFELSHYPSVTIVVPCWNDGAGLAKTIDSLKQLDYPKDKLKILAVDDGSTDNSWAIMQQYKTKYPDIQIHHKENGGKHTALNYGITTCTTDLIGCLDADSEVDKYTLKKLVSRFDNPKTMAVTPAMKIHNPKTIVQMIQSAEYIFGILVKKVMGILGAIHVTPGPFTIFRRTLFDKIGLFRPAHNTEDMEIAFRMHSHHQEIDNVHNAWVYTTGPSTVYKLYRQRVRWTYGFLQNCRDYKHLFFNPKYGNLGFLTLPVAFALIISVIFTVGFLVYRILHNIYQLYIQWRTVGFLWPHVTFNWFFISTKAHLVLGIFIYTLMLTLLLSAQRLVGERPIPNRAMLYYFLIYPFISPFWILRSIYNAIVSKKTSWR